MSTNVVASQSHKSQQHVSFPATGTAHSLIPGGRFHDRDRNGRALGFPAHWSLECIQCFVPTSLFLHQAVITMCGCVAWNNSQYSQTIRISRLSNSSEFIVCFGEVGTFILTKTGNASSGFILPENSLAGIS